MVNFKIIIHGMLKHLFENTFAVSQSLGSSIFFQYVSIAVILNACTYEVFKDPCQDKIPVQLVACHSLSFI